MGYSCEAYREYALRAEQRVFSEIATPQVGEWLETRTADTGSKVLVSKRRGIIACLAPGDRVWISGGSDAFCAYFGIPKAGSRAATFRMDGAGDEFELDHGLRIPLSNLSRKNRVRVVELAAKRHSEEEPSGELDAVGAEQGLLCVA